MMMPSSAARVEAGCSARASIQPELSVQYRTNGHVIPHICLFRHYLLVGCACAPIDKAFRASGQNESLSSQKAQ
jgi:hypothetical protein